FEAGRWTRAAEAFEMVGTAVPEDEAKTNEAVLVEAGQRVYIHVRDKDLSILESIGEKSYVEIASRSGDSERIELVRFGRAEGEFIGSVQTTSEASAKNDGRLTIRGADAVVATYVDANTEKGEVNRRVLAEASVVSSASIAFLDGAQRQSINGVFAGQPAFVQVKDFDLDVSDKPDAARILVKTLYRERPEPAPGETQAPPPAPDAPWLIRTEKELDLVETGPHTGVFAGRIVPRLVPDGETPGGVALAPGEVAVRPDEKIAVEYKDEKHLGGEKSVVRAAEAFVLVGGSTDPQSTVSHSSIPAVQAKKLLIEARLLCKWGRIFKEVGLQENADSKADEGLSRIAEIFEIASRSSLDRSLVEEAYEVRWSLFIVKDNFRQAIATCNALVKRYPDTVLADRAFMQIATARIQEDTTDSRKSALEVLAQIINLPTSPLKAEAQYRIGEVREAEVRAQMEDPRNAGRKPDFSAAIAAFRLCAETYPSSSFAGESYKRIVDYDVSIKNYASAQETLERVFQDYPDAPWLDEMLLKWGVVKHRMGDGEGAKAKFRQLLDEYPGGKAAKTATEFLEKLGE
ncbi:MAG: tetratricopeptide repeat protein, partial [Kiritimatiellae bacterium]|nr:tetratricopeptide repeat protein [Kiritimatiellia bacterium]